MEYVIEIKSLNKSFKDVHAVNDLSFKVKKGEFFSFLGENGAGKSTTIAIIAGELQKDSGSVYICGKNIDEGMDDLTCKIGVVYQSSVLDMPLTVKDNLESRAALYGITKEDFKNRLDELADILDFKNLLNRTLGKLSGGQKRRIDIARALIHKPEILILDEPTTGLDPQTRKLLWNVINDLRIKEQMTVFLTTHYMEEVADSDYVVILDHGKVCAEGTPLELKNKYTGDYITIYNIEEDKIKVLGLNYEVIKDAIRIEIENTTKATELIISHPELFKDYEIIKGKMDDVFLNVTGKNLIEGEDK